jgi:hypothetical protein
MVMGVFSERSARFARNCTRMNTRAGYSKSIPAVEQRDTWSEAAESRSRSPIGRQTENILTEIGASVPRGSLVEWVKDEVERLNWNSACVESGRPAFPPRSAIMLSVLALSRLMQRQSSQEIARACATEPGFMNLCEGCPPSASELDQSGHEYHTQLVTVVRNILARTVPDWSFRSVPISLCEPEEFIVPILHRKEKRCACARSFAAFKRSLPPATKALVRVSWKHSC